MSHWRLWTMIVLSSLVVVLGGTTYSYRQKYLDLKKNPQRVSEETTAKLVAEVGRLIILPDNETPTIATVSDPAKLADQPFFSRAREGDKVLIYGRAKKAILYDPRERKIVEVAPINSGTPTPTVAPSSSS